MEVKAWIVTTAAPEAGGRLLARDGIGGIDCKPIRLSGADGLLSIAWSPPSQ